MYFSHSEPIKRNPVSIRLDDFTIMYGSFVAVDHLTTELPRGTIGLLGPNGAGKSSLIKGLLGLVPYAEGTAEIMGSSIAGRADNIRQLVGYMPEDNCLVPGLTGVGMVQYAGELCGMTKQDAMHRAHEVLYLTGLEEARYRKVQSYSSGMKQRIKLAQALVHDPKLLFLDEPTSGMDPKGRQEMLDLIVDIANNGRMSIVVATHILTDVERTCERVVIMHRGRVVEDSRVDDIRKSYANTYSVRVTANDEEFYRYLEKSGCSIVDYGKDIHDITLPKGATTRLVVEAAGRTNAGLRKIVPSVRSLEDVFMKRILEGTSADI